MNKLLLLAFLVAAGIALVTARQQRFKFEIEIEMEPKGSGVEEDD